MADSLIEVHLPADFGLLGLRLKQQVISSLKPEKQDFWTRRGVRAGDLILSVDGRAAHGLSASDLVLLLRKRPVTLQLRVHQEAQVQGRDATAQVQRPDAGRVQQDSSGKAQADTTKENASAQAVDAEAQGADGSSEDASMIKLTEEELLTAAFEPTSMEEIFAKAGPSSQQKGVSLGFLSDLRRHLAEAKISRVPTQYLSLCRHLVRANYARSLRQMDKAQGSDAPLRALCKLPGCAGVEQIRRVASAPRQLAHPCILKQGSFQAISAWKLGWWQQNHGDWLWLARTRTPAFAEDEGPDAIGLEVRIADYIDYSRVLMLQDPTCAEEAALSHPRVTLEGWPCFRAEGSLWELFRGMWKELTPPGVENLTAAWAQHFVSRFDIDWQEWLSRYYKVCFAGPGCVRRLCKENCGAHLWLAQLDGRQLVYMFAPRETEKLQEATGSRVDGASSYAESVSPIDILFPSGRRQATFKEAQAQAAILQAGETLLIPSGWWWYAVALEPSVTLQQSFFNRSNMRSMAQHLANLLEVDTMPSDMADHFLRGLAEAEELLLEEEEG